MSNPLRSEATPDSVPATPTEQRIVVLDETAGGAVRELLAEAHGDAVAAWHDRIWHWKVARNPAATPGTAYRIGLFDGDRLCGAITLMPLRVQLAGTVHEAAVPLDNVVTRRQRPAGLAGAARKLGAEVVRLSPPLIYGAVDERNRTLWHRTFRHEPLIGRFRRLHRVLSLAPVLRGHRVPHLAAMLAGALYGVVDAAANLVAAWRAPRDVAVVPVTAIDDSFDALWTSAAPSHQNVIMRDRAFLEWRFRGLPGRAYIVLGARRAGSLVGYTVLRFIDDGEFSKAVIVDLFTRRDEPAIFRALLGGAVTEARRRGAATVSMLEMPHPSERHETKLALFFADSKTVCMIAHSNVFALAEYADPAKWWFTLADADLDIVG